MQCSLLPDVDRFQSAQIKATPLSAVSASFATPKRALDVDAPLRFSNPFHLQFSTPPHYSVAQCACQPAARTRDAERHRGGDAGSTSMRGWSDGYMDDEMVGERA